QHRVGTEGIRRITSFGLIETAHNFTAISYDEAGRCCQWPIFLHLLKTAVHHDTARAPHPNPAGIVVAKIEQRSGFISWGHGDSIMRLARKCHKTINRAPLGSLKVE